jgi:hypothetical protein
VQNGTGGLGSLSKQLSSSSSNWSRQHQAESSRQVRSLSLHCFGERAGAHLVVVEAGRLVASLKQSNRHTLRHGHIPDCRLLAPKHTQALSAARFAFGAAIHCRATASPALLHLPGGSTEASAWRTPSTQPAATPTHIPQAPSINREPPTGGLLEDWPVDADGEGAVAGEGDKRAPIVQQSPRPCRFSIGGVGLSEA